MIYFYSLFFYNKSNEDKYSIDRRRLEMKSRISGYTQLIGIIASPIRHSISPKMHNAAFEKLGLDYAYLAFEIIHFN